MEYKHTFKDISELSNWDKNPRDIDDKELKRLKEQITELGIYKPFIILEDGTVIGGNMRLTACNELGIKGKVPVSIIYPKSEEEKIKYALSDNDRAGHYVEDKLKELVISHPALQLSSFSVDLGKQVTLKSLASDLNEEKFDNQEVDLDKMDDTSILKLVYSGDRYLEVLDMLEEAKLEEETNEDLVYRLLKNELQVE